MLCVQGVCHIFYGAWALQTHYMGSIFPSFCHFICSPPFLAHLSRRLEWAIVIAHRPSSVRPSVRRPSVRKLFTFSTSSPEPLDGFWWNLVGMKYSWSLTSVVVFSARSPQGRIQGGAKIGHGGPLLQETSSSDRKATATNWMHSNDLEACVKKCCYFWFHSEVKFLTRFWRLFGLCHFALF